VLDRSAHVLGGDVATLQAGHQLAILLIHPPPSRRIAGAAGVPSNHPLAAAPPEPGESVLVGHAAREPQAVAQKALDRVITPEPHPASSLAAAGSVNDRHLEHARLRRHLHEDPLVLVKVAPVLLKEPRQRLQSRMRSADRPGLVIPDQIETPDPRLAEPGA